MTTGIRLVHTSRHSATTVHRSSVWSNFSQKSHDLITLPDHETNTASQEAQLLELLSYLEKEVVTLQSKLFTLYDTLNDVTQRVYSVLRYASITETGGTDADRS